MIGWLIDLVPAWVWLIAGVAAAIAAWRLLGWHGLLAAGAAAGAILTYREGRQAGASDALAGVKKANDKAVKDHDEIEAKTDRMSDDQLGAANHPWVRKRR